MVVDTVKIDTNSTVVAEAVMVGAQVAQLAVFVSVTVAAADSRKETISGRG